MCMRQQRFGLDVQCSALVHNFNTIFSNGHLYRAGQLINSLPSQILERYAPLNRYSIMLKLLYMSFLAAFFSCQAKKDFSEDFKAWPYDPSIISSLSKYDSIRQAVISNIGNFDFSDIGERFTYVYNFDSLSNISGYSNDSLPKPILPFITRIIKELGKEKIRGFVISKDSSFDIWVRATHLQKYFLDVREQLHWKTSTKHFEHLPFPFKDTMLSNRWQYVVWFDKREEIF